MKGNDQHDIAGQPFRQICKDVFSFCKEKCWRYYLIYLLDYKKFSVGKQGYDVFCSLFPLIPYSMVYLAFNNRNWHQCSFVVFYLSFQSYEVRKLAPQA